jgi:hypothetical protein
MLAGEVSRHGKLVDSSIHHTLGFSLYGGWFTRLLVMLKMEETKQDHKENDE